MVTAFRPHILVVDDDTSVRDALSAALADRYAVHAAATGAEGLACLRAYPVAAVILDAILQGEHGLDLVEPFRTIRAAPSSSSPATAPKGSPFAPSARTWPTT
ncbi:MAG: response regulator [Zetaproteobacteria bacterium]|nr:MAG: response regulator [Zetaproteobacteria bacterium]